MHRLIPATLALFASFGCAASAQDIDPILRSASRMQAVRDLCPAFFRLDRARAGNYRDAFVDIGVRSVGRAAFGRRLGTDVERRRREVAQAGPRAWCAEQRKSLRSIGVSDVFLD